MQWLRSTFAVFRGYEGDTVRNVFGDLVAFAAGWWWLRVVPHWAVALAPPALAAAVAYVKAPPSAPAPTTKAPSAPTPRLPKPFVVVMMQGHRFLRLPDAFGPRR